MLNETLDAKLDGAAGSRCKINLHDLLFLLFLLRSARRSNRQI